jgi:hypothetical protein
VEAHIRARVKLLEKEDVDPMVKQIYQKIEDV